MPIGAPAGSLAVLRDVLRLELYRRLVWGQPKGVAAQPLDEYVVTPPRRFAVIRTPGHCPGHVCFLEEDEGWLFSGDLLLHEGGRYLREAEGAYQIAASLRRALALRRRLLMCSEAGFVEAGETAMARKIAYWEGVFAEARALRERVYSVERIAGVLGPEGPATRISGGGFSKTSLIASLLKEAV